MNIHDDINALTQSNLEVAKAVTQLAAVMAQFAMLQAGPAAGRVPAKQEQQEELPLDTSADKPGKAKAEKPGKTKAEKPASKPAPEPEADDTDADDDDDPSPTFTKEDVKVALAELPRDEIVKILKKHGATALRDLPEESFGAAIAMAKKVQASLED
jgi:type IV secretory pathway VirB10-like protein